MDAAAGVGWAFGEDYVNGNYALFFRFWDRLLGTEVPEYEQRFVERGGAVAPPSP